MRDCPIIFSTPMVLALLREARQSGAGKTQTRRALTRLTKFGAITEFGPSDTRGYDWHFRDKALRWHDLRDAEMKARLPYAVGDRLYVREAWTHDAADLDELRAKVEDAFPDFSYGPFYRATEPAPRTMRWRPSIHMPRWASRLILIVADVRVERLNDISDADAVSEGIYARGTVGDDPVADVWAWQREGWRYPTPREAFKALWAEIHGSDAWAANPWVVAISFRPILANIDAHPKAGGLQDERGVR